MSNEIFDSILLYGGCLRRNYCAIIKDSMGAIISVGFTQSPNGCEQCKYTGECIRNDLNIPSGCMYEICDSVHAEMNAILEAKCNLLGSTMYLYGVDAETNKPIKSTPCNTCLKHIINAGISKLVCFNFDDPLIYTGDEIKLLYKRNLLLSKRSARNATVL